MNSLILENIVHSILSLINGHKISLSNFSSRTNNYDKRIFRNYFILMKTWRLLDSFFPTSSSLELQYREKSISSIHLLFWITLSLWYRIFEFSWYRIIIFFKNSTKFSSLSNDGLPKNQKRFIRLIQSDSFPHAIFFNWMKSSKLFGDL